MKKQFLMDCQTVMNTAYEADKDNSLSILAQVRLSLHLFSCSACAGELKNLRRVEEIMKTDFLPPSPDFANILMERLYEESAMEREIAAPAGVSFRGWVIIGCFVFISLSSAFFGGNFIHIANVGGSSFLVPVGITIGVVLTCYGALFIGSHLKELSTRFGLR